jgi:hypothetical protein
MTAREDPSERGRQFRPRSTVYVVVRGAVVSITILKLR